MKLALSSLLACACLVLSACAVRTGTAENHDSVSLRFFIAGEGELAFCIAAPNPNPYQDSEPLKILNFQEEDTLYLVFRYYDPVSYGYTAGLSKLRFVVYLKDLSGLVESDPLEPWDLWEKHFYPIDMKSLSQGEEARFANPSTEVIAGRTWLTMDLVPSTTHYSGETMTADPGRRFASVIWGRYLLDVSLIFQRESKAYERYLAERMWIAEKVLNSLRVGEIPGEEVHATCDG